ncbi:MAG TPA: hypothetical protein VER37_00545 [Thermomicrobiales bacterium]|nr:hypothetical protein [Thermomicrobiales bacterium]
MEPYPAGDEEREPRAAGEEGGQRRTGRKHVLEVVQHQQPALPTEPRHDGRREGEFPRFDRLDRLGDRMEHAVRLGHGGQIDQMDASREGILDGCRDRQGQAGLADAAGSRQRQQPGVALGEHRRRLGHVALAADERAWRREREGHRVGAGGAARSG